VKELLLTAWETGKNHTETVFCKLLRSPGIDSKKSIPPTYAAWRAGTSNRIAVSARQAVNRFLGSVRGFRNSGLYCTVLYTSTDMHAMPKKMLGNRQNMHYRLFHTEFPSCAGEELSKKGKLKMLKRAQIDSIEILEDPTIERVGGGGGGGVSNH
jgi:hypothetical protein